MTTREIMYGITGVMVGVLFTSTLVLVTGACSGISVETPFVDVHNPPEPIPSDPDTCVIDGRLVLPRGAVLNCETETAVPEPTPEPSQGPPPRSISSDLRDRGADPISAPEPPAEGDYRQDLEELFGDAGETFKRTLGSSIERQILAGEIVVEEGGSNLAYCDETGLHIGDGSKIHISDREREELLCRELEQAEEEAQRVLGNRVFRRLDEVRQDVWIEMCYWSACRTFTRAREATVEGDYRAAAREIWDSELQDIDPDRAERMARWMMTGIR